MANVPLSSPPNSFEVLNDKVHTPNWQQWFVDLHRKIAPNINRQYLTAAAVINVDSTHVSLSTTAAGSTYAVTLAAPTIPGLIMMIEMIARNGAKNVTLSLTNVDGGSAATTCTWSGVGQKLLLMAGDSKWTVFKERGVALT